MKKNTQSGAGRKNVVAVFVSSTEPKNRHSETNKRSPLRTPLQLLARGTAGFWLGSARRLEAENCFAFFHQVETITGNGFQIG